MEEKSEQIIGDAMVSHWQAGLTTAINDTYSFANNNLFYAMLPSFYRDYAWKYIRPALEWMDGYVPSIHSPELGIISTRIASRLITGLTKQIVGEKLLLRKNKDPNGQYLAKVAEWMKKANVLKAVYSGIGFSLAAGTSMLKVNLNAKGMIWWQGCRFDQCQYLSSFSNEVQDATFYIRSYVDTRNPNQKSQEDTKKIQFYLVEHRFYKIYDKPSFVMTPNGSLEVIHAKGDIVPMVEFSVKRIVGTMQNNMMPTNFDSQTVKWDELPKDIRKMIKDDFGPTFRVGEPDELPFRDLGCYPLLNGEIDLSVPTGTNFGESMLVGIQDDLLTYEIASSYLIRDMYLGKGTIYLPKSLNMADFITAGTTVGTPTPEMPSVASESPLGGFGNKAIELMKGVDPEQQKAIVEQFDLRATDWQTIKENCLKNIAIKWGMSPKIIASFLTNGTAAQTATQVDSEDDACVAFIYHTRSYFKHAINSALETTLVYMNMPEDAVTIDFASPSLVNKDRLLNRVTTELDAGLIDIEDAIRTLYPDLDEEAIQIKVQKALQQQQMMMMQQMTEMNSEGGGFGPEEPENEANEGELVGAGPVN